MALMKPREWLGYSVEVNDLLPQAAELIARFEEGQIPLHDTFGSNSDPPVPPPPLIVFFGPGVEPARLLEVLSLLNEVRFLQAGTGNADRKRILIGSYNGDGQPLTPYSHALARRFEVPGLTSPALTDLVLQAARIRAVR